MRCMNIHNYILSSLSARSQHHRCRPSHFNTTPSVMRMCVLSRFHPQCSLARWQRPHNIIIKVKYEKVREWVNPLASFWWNWVEDWGRGWGWWWCACRRQTRGAFTRMSLFWNPPFLWVPASLFISLFFLLCLFNSERALNVNDEMRVRALDDMNFEMSKRRTVRLCTKRVKDLKDVRMELYCALRPSTSTSAEKKFASIQQARVRLCWVLWFARISI